MTSRNIKLRSELKKLVGEQVEDIILFGSTVRGKRKPRDTDILVVFKKKVIKEAEYQIRKKLEQYFPGVALISKTSGTLLEPTFDARESALFEGMSLITGQNLARRYGFISFGMFKYTFGKWEKLQKTKFYYALNGRKGNKGISQKLECLKLSDRIILAPLGNIEPFREFLDSWKLEYTYVPTMIPERLSHKKILEA